MIYMLVAALPHVHSQPSYVRRCFRVFKVIHQLVDTEEDIFMVRPSGLEIKTSLSTLNRSVS